MAGHTSQGWGAGHVSCKGQTERSIWMAWSSPIISLCLSRDRSEVLAPHTRVWLAADPLASSASEGGREVMIRDTLK